MSLCNKRSPFLFLSMGKFTSVTSATATTYLASHEMRHFYTNKARLTTYLTRLLANATTRMASSESRLASSSSSLKKTKINVVDDENCLLYESAIRALNLLQSNAAVIEAARIERKNNPLKNIVFANHYLKLLGVGQDDLDRLNCIHVAGTKGKGSTCALTESILRSFGLKTALFTSPHLAEVKERLSINGRAMSKKEFSKYFWQVYKVLKDKSSESQALGIPELPTYFCFLTVMAFYSFLCESVDVAIIEVGVGGEFDCTNVIQKPVVTAVTSLGIDHTLLLGDTIDQIAWQKSGIFKNNTPAFTLNQEPSAMDVLISRAVEKSVEKLTVIPSILPALKSVKLGISGKIQLLNASLAVHLATIWLQRKSQFNVPDVSSDESYTLPEHFIHGLSTCKWPGRFQVVRDPEKGSITYFMDGAHTKESIQLATEWFVEQSSSNCPKAIRVLMFYVTGYRDSKDMLKCLLDTFKKHSNEPTFDKVIFTPNFIFTEQSASSDLCKVSVDTQAERTRADSLKSSWLTLMDTEKSTNSVISSTCISDAINCLRDSIAPETNLPVHVFVTGSLLLVGSTLSFLKV